MTIGQDSGAADVAAELPALAEQAATEPTPVRPRERVLKNAVATVVARAAADAFHVVAGLKQARYLGDQGWGLFGYLLSSTDVLKVLTNFGLDVVCIRQMAVGARTPRAIQHHLMLLKTLLAGVGLLAVAVLSLFMTRFAENRGSMLVLGLGLLPIGYQSSLFVRFQVEHRMERLIPVQFASGLLYLAAVYLGAWGGIGVHGFVWLYVGFQTMVVVLTLLAQRLTWPSASEPAEPPGTDWGLVWAIFRQTIPVGISMALVVAYSRLGVFIVEQYGTLAEVGHYFMAIKVCEPVLAIAGALSLSAYPVLSRLAEQRERPELQRRFVSYSIRSAMLSATVAGALTIWGVNLLRLIKPEYAAASGALSALAWAAVCMFQNQLSTATINAFNKFHYVTGFAAVNLCTFLTFSLLLVPRLGPTGAGLSTLGTEGINSVMQLVTLAVMLRRIGSAR